MRARTVLAFVVIAVLAACGGREQRTGKPTRDAAAPPGEPKVAVADLEGPPAAWLETERGSVWLGFSTFCWKTACADYVAPSCAAQRHVPRIVVRRGELVTAHLAFTPRKLTLTYFLDGEPTSEPPHQRLRATKEPAWRVEREGAFSLSAVADAGGDASYVGCFSFG